MQHSRHNLSAGNGVDNFCLQIYGQKDVARSTNRTTGIQAFSVLIEQLAKKSRNGDVYVNLSRQHLKAHEWGLARKALLSALEHENLSDREETTLLLRHVNDILK
ncbi:MAG: hypothetical protein ACR2QW_03235 [bacterium]